MTEEVINQATPAIERMIALGRQASAKADDNESATLSKKDVADIVSTLFNTQATLSYMLIGLTEMNASNFDRGREKLSRATDMIGENLKACMRLLTKLADEKEGDADGV